MGEFERNLRAHVAGIKDHDIERIVAVAKADDGKTLEAIADDIHISRDALNYSLRKLFRSRAVSGINCLSDLRDWVRGLIADPFEDPITVVDEFTDLRRTDTVAFVYGSLLDPHSLARTTGQDPSTIEYLPAQLANHVAEWGGPSHRLNYSDAEWRSLDDVLWLWLTIRRTGNPADLVHGALIRLRGPQYRQVRGRESHYHEVNVIDDIRVMGVRVKTSVGALYNEIVTFAPDLSRLSEDRTGGRTAVRAGYYDDTDEYLSRIHPGKGTRLPELPTGVERLEGYPTDDHVADEFWKKVPVSRLNTYYFALDKELYGHDVTRQTSLGFETIPFVMRPFILNRRTYREVVKAAESAVSLSVKAHRVVLEDPQLFELNGYTGADRRLSDPELANNRTDRPVVARVDLALRGDRLTVFEVNTDSPAGMFHLDQLAERQWRQIESREFTGDLVEVLEPPRNERVCETIVEAFCQGWERYRERRSDPGLRGTPRRIAIVDRDIDRVAAYTEFEHFGKLLLMRMYGRELDENLDEVVILDANDLRYREDHKELVDNSGRPIDAVYKRLLWQDAIGIGMGGLDDPLCRAYLDNSVFVMNSFRSRLAGSKLNMAIAKSPSFEARCNDIGIDLTDDERDALEKNIPETLLWGSTPLDHRGAEELKARVMSDVTDWVLKGYHGKGGQEFIDGAPSRDVPPVDKFQDSWKTGGYIAQRHQDHGMASIPLVDNRQHGTVWSRYPFILGAYVIDGRCVAVEAKVDRDIPINVNRGGRRTAVFALKA